MTSLAGDAAQRRGGVPFARRLPRTFYAVCAVLFVSGAAWIWAGGVLAGGLNPAAVSARVADLLALLLEVHGGAAMLFLILLGAFATQHVQVLWRGGRNRPSGAVMLTLNAVLIMTAYGLYYSGSDVVRNWVSDLHIVAGLALPIVIAHHVWSGRRRRRRTASNQTV